LRDGAPVTNGWVYLQKARERRGGSACEKIAGPGGVTISVQGAAKLKDLREAGADVLVKKTVLVKKLPSFEHQKRLGDTESSKTSKSGDSSGVRAQVREANDRPDARSCQRKSTDFMIPG